MGYTLENPPSITSFVVFPKPGQVFHHCTPLQEAFSFLLIFLRRKSLFLRVTTSAWTFRNQPAVPVRTLLGLGTALIQRSRRRRSWSKPQVRTNWNKNHRLSELLGKFRGPPPTRSAAPYRYRAFRTRWWSFNTRIGSRFETDDRRPRTAGCGDTDRQHRPWERPRLRLFFLGTRVGIGLLVRVRIQFE